MLPVARYLSGKCRSDARSSTPDRSLLPPLFHHRFGRGSGNPLSMLHSRRLHTIPDESPPSSLRRERVKIGRAAQRCNGLCPPLRAIACLCVLLQFFVYGVDVALM